MSHKYFQKFKMNCIQSIGGSLRLFFYWQCLYIYRINSEIFSDSPNVKPTATKGMIIDAGSGGSRMHVFSWKQRIFSQVPPPISYPEANEAWAARQDPGLSTYSEQPKLVKDHLLPLIDFAKATLGGMESEFGDFPIYLKATGGMRELPLEKREELLKYVRMYLSDKSFCPFFFRDDFARIISGEEEAIYSWAATNFLMGSLLPASQGTGAVVDKDLNSSYGTLDLGGSSTQIAFFVPTMDISEGLFKLQIGTQKHWNVYTKSFLKFGIVSARKRHITGIADAFYRIYNTTGPHSRNVIPPTINNCFHTGYSEHAMTSFGNQVVEITGPPNPYYNQLALCMDSVRSLLELQNGAFCDSVYNGDCSIAGAYQPPLPQGKHGNFIGTSSYKYPWKFLMMPRTATLRQMQDKAEYICKLNFDELNFYYVSNNLNMGTDKLAEFMPYYCFLSSYVLVLLQDGYRFKPDQTLTVLDEVGGHKVGWALGAILYEINTLPWILEENVLSSNPLLVVFAAVGFGLLMGIVATSCVCTWMEAKQPSIFGIAPSMSYSRSFSVLNSVNSSNTHLNSPTPSSVDVEMNVQNTRMRAYSAPPNLVVNELLANTEMNQFSSPNGATDSEQSEIHYYNGNSSGTNNGTKIGNNGLNDIESRGRSNSNSSDTTSNKTTVPLHGILRYNTDKQNKTKSNKGSNEMNRQFRPIQQQIGRIELNQLTIGSLSSTSGDTLTGYPILNNNKKSQLNGMQMEEETPLLRPVFNETNLSSNNHKAKYSNS